MRRGIWIVGASWLILVAALSVLARLGSPAAAPLTVLLFPLLVVTGYVLPWRISAISLAAVTALLLVLGPDAIPAHLNLGTGELSAGATTFVVAGVLMGLGLGARLAKDHAREAAQAAVLRASNAELEAFAYTVAHDLRAPLRAIRAYASELREDHANELGPDGRESLANLTLAEARMSQFIERLLTFAKAAGQELTREPIDMERLASEVALELRADEPDRVLTIRVGHLPPAEGDEIFIREALQNLIGNAVKYTRTRAAAEVEVGWAPEASAYFVRDNGVGFDMKDARRLFGVFSRLHDPTRSEGTGVGLAVTQRIIARHGGRIWAGSAVDRGATFYFTLPRQRSRASTWWSHVIGRARAARAQHRS